MLGRKKKQIQALQLHVKQLNELVFSLEKKNRSLENRIERLLKKLEKREAKE